MEFSDIELSEMVKENDDDAKDVLYDKYNYIIDIVMAKYKKTFYTLDMDQREVRQDALVAFTKAIIKFNPERDASLPTFISVVVDRKIKNAIRNAESAKNKKNKENYSLDHEYSVWSKPLKEVIGDLEYDPLTQMESSEGLEELEKNIKKKLSKSEYEVYELLISEMHYTDIAKKLKRAPKQIDNTIQRIRSKIKDLL